MTNLPNCKVGALCVDVRVVGQQKRHGDVRFVRDQLAEVARLHNVRDGAVLSLYAETQVLSDLQVVACGVDLRVHVRKLEPDDVDVNVRHSECRTSTTLSAYVETFSSAEMLLQVSPDSTE